MARKGDGLLTYFKMNEKKNKNKKSRTIQVKKVVTDGRWNEKKLNYKVVTNLKGEDFKDCDG